MNAWDRDDPRNDEPREYDLEGPESHDPGCSCRPCRVDRHDRELADGEDRYVARAYERDERAKDLEP